MLCQKLVLLSVLEDQFSAMKLMHWHCSPAVNAYEHEDNNRETSSGTPESDGPCDLKNESWQGLCPLRKPLELVPCQVCLRAATSLVSRHT